MMFKKKINCKKCSNKIDKNFDFCPHCGNVIKDHNESEDWGMLGKNDLVSEDNLKMPFGFNLIFNSLVKNLDKQLKEFDKQLGKEIADKKQKNPKQSKGISISITSSMGKAPKIDIQTFGDMTNTQQKIQKINKSKNQHFSEESIKKLSILPRVEPSTNVRRLSNKIIYEIDVPGVKSNEDISIIQLENSIEIKAIGKDKAYFKLIPINFPIKKHKLEKGKLFIELDSR